LPKFLSISEDAVQLPGRGRNGNFPISTQPGEEAQEAGPPILADALKSHRKWTAGKIEIDGKTESVIESIEVRDLLNHPRRTLIFNQDSGPIRDNTGPIIRARRRSRRFGCPVMK